MTPKQVIFEYADYQHLQSTIERLERLLTHITSIQANPVTTEQETLLTPKKACEFLDISPSLFFELVAAGEIKPFGKVGKVKRYHKQDLVCYVQRNATPVTMPQLPKVKFKK